MVYATVYLQVAAHVLGHRPRKQAGTRPATAFRIHVNLSQQVFGNGYLGPP